MRVGISLTSHHDVADPREAARWMIERAQAARPAGLDSLFLGDHHAESKPYYQNVPMLGRLLAEWDERPAG
jgi:alkanesulfonate monooxygenase SsuD/methylene tetrahydromethanopterin reductase-like flavin-dependent oxidoreductase (luciferase family)